MNQTKTKISYQCVKCGLFQNSDSYICSTCKFDSSGYYINNPNIQKLKVDNNVTEIDLDDIKADK